MMNNGKRPELGKHDSVMQCGFWQTMLIRANSAELSRSFPVESAPKPLLSAALRLRERTTAGKKSWPVLGAKVGANESQFPHFSGMRRRGVADPFVTSGTTSEERPCVLCASKRGGCALIRAMGSPRSRPAAYSS